MPPRTPPLRFHLSAAEWDNRKRKAGNRIRSLRNAHELTLQGFADAIGYDSHATVSDWEQGKHFPSGEALTAMHELYGQQIPWLLGVPEASGDEDVPAIAPGLLAQALVDYILQEYRRRSGPLGEGADIRSVLRLTHPLEFLGGVLDQALYGHMYARTSEYPEGTFNVSVESARLGVPQNTGRRPGRKR